MMLQYLYYFVFIFLFPISPNGVCLMRLVFDHTVTSTENIRTGRACTTSHGPNLLA